MNTESMENIDLIEKFIKKFIFKNKRDRAYIELTSIEERRKFTDRLNHNWDKYIDMRYLTPLSADLQKIKYIKPQMNIGKTNACYVISDYSDSDNLIMDFDEAFNKLHGRGFASIILNLDITHLYLETEIVPISKQIRYIGKNLGNN